MGDLRDRITSISTSTNTKALMLAGLRVINRKMTFKVDDQIKCRYALKGGGYRGQAWIGTVKQVSPEPERYLVTVPEQVAPTWMLAHEVRPLSDPHWEISEAAAVAEPAPTIFGISEEAEPVPTTIESDIADWIYTMLGDIADMSSPACEAILWTNWQDKCKNIAQVFRSLKEGGVLEAVENEDPTDAAKVNITPHGRTMLLDWRKERSRG